MRLIDADDLLLRFIPRGGDNNFTRFIRETVRLRIAEAPTIDAEPTKHGRWIYDEKTGNYYCSECRRRGGVYIDEAKGVELLGNYCGNCGAKMDESEAGE